MFMNVKIEALAGRPGRHPLRTAFQLLTFGVLPFWLQVAALAVAPRLNNILPAGGQRGTTLQVTFSGQRLQDTREIVLYNPGLTATAFEAGTNQVKVSLQISPDCPLGEHQLRLRTATGISEVRTFWVGALTNLTETEPNSDLPKAQRVPMNCTVHGTIPSEDIDYFLVEAEKGRRLSVEIEGMRLGRGAFDPYISIRRTNGSPVASSDDSALGFQDGVLSIVAPETGPYLVQVRETGYAGADGYYYRLHIGEFPRPLAVYPAAAQAGQTVTVRFIGDALGDFEQKITPPAKPREKFAVFAVQTAAAPKDAGTTNPPPTGAFIAPTPNWMRIVPHPTTLEAEPNDTREQAAPAVDCPVVFNGILSKKRDQDWFRFRARKGQNLQVNVFSRRLRSPLDSALQVVNAKGSVIAENDDAAGPDSAVTFKPDEDGEFAVRVRDHLRRGGAEFVYSVEVAPAEPSLTVKFPEVARNDSQSRQYLAVPRGNRFATLLSVRRTASPGDLTIRGEGLPKGLRLLTPAMPGKVDQFPMVFEADANAPVDGRLADLVVAATNGVSGRYQNDIELVQGPNNTSYYNTRVDQLAAAVTEAAPFKVRVVEPKVPLVQGGSMDLQIVAERDPGFDEPINVQVLWRPPGISALPDMTIPKGSNAVSYVLNAKGDAEVRAWPMVVTASAKVRDGDLFVASQPAHLEVGEPFLAATIERAACEPGQSTNIVVKLEQKISFEGQATIRLIGLSDRISVPEKQITAADKEVIFPVKVDPACSPGSQRNLFCAVNVPKNGTVIPHAVGSGGSFRVVPPRKPVVESGQKKVASR